MDGEAILKELGKPYSDVGVQRLVKELGLKKIPKAKPKEPDDYLQAKEFGVELAFTDEDYLGARKVPRYGNADMILTRATLYAPEGEPGYKGFKGLLPGGVALSDSVERVVAKLGPPAQIFERGGVVKTRTWRTDGYLSSFSYSPDGPPKYEQIILAAYFDRIS